MNSFTLIRAIVRVFCNALQYIATPYSTLHHNVTRAYLYLDQCHSMCTATHYNTLQPTATHNNILQHIYIYTLIRAIMCVLRPQPPWQIRAKYLFARDANQCHKTERRLFLAVFCSVLQWCVAVCCSAFQCVVVFKHLCACDANQCHTTPNRAS